MSHSYNKLINSGNNNKKVLYGSNVFRVRDRLPSSNHQLYAFLSCLPLPTSRPWSPHIVETTQEHKGLQGLASILKQKVCQYREDSYSLCACIKFLSNNMRLFDRGHTTPGSQAWWAGNCEDSNHAQRKTMGQDQQGTAERVRNNNSARPDTPLDQ